MRCDGTAPCGRCISHNVVCRYEAPYLRRKQSHISTEVEKREDDESMQPSRSSSSGREYHDTNVKRECNIGEKSLRDPDDMEDIGGSSSIAFLNRARRRLERYRASARFSFGDSQIPDFDAASFVLPSVDEARHLVAYYFDYIASTHRFLHRPTIESQLESFYSDRNLIMCGRSLDRCICASLFTIFAQASLYLHPCPDSGVSYYLAAERQVESQQGTKLESVQARLLMVLYLLMSSRFNRAWSLLGTTIRMAQVLGLHRKHDRKQGNVVEMESSKRTFWTCYVVDRTLSVLLGRPCAIHDLDVDQDLPRLVDDDDLHLRLNEDGHITCPLSISNQTLIGASCEHIKLSQIVSVILSDFYSAKKVVRECLAENHLYRLSMWKGNLPPFLDAEKPEPDTLVPIIKRARITLQFAYHHAMMLVYRPFLLASPNEFSPAWVETATSECLRLSGLLVSFTTNLAQQGMLTGAFWFSIYNAFNAILIVYVHTIQNVFPGMVPSDIFSIAENCEETLNAHTQGNVLAQRYLAVLQELRSEIKEQMSSCDSANAGLDLLLEAPNLAARPQNSDWYAFDTFLMDTLTGQLFESDPQTQLAQSQIAL